MIPRAQHRQQQQPHPHHSHPLRRQNSFNVSSSSGMQGSGSGVSSNNKFSSSASATSKHHELAKIAFIFLSVYGLVTTLYFVMTSQVDGFVSTNGGGSNSVKDGMYAAEAGIGSQQTFSNGVKKPSAIVVASELTKRQTLGNEKIPKETATNGLGLDTAEFSKRNRFFRAFVNFEKFAPAPTSPSLKEEQNPERKQQRGNVQQGDIRRDHGDINKGKNKKQKDKHMIEEGEEEDTDLKNDDDTVLMQVNVIDPKVKRPIQIHGGREDDDNLEEDHAMGKARDGGGTNYIPANGAIESDGEADNAVAALPLAGFASDSVEFGVHIPNTSEMEQVLRAYYMEHEQENNEHTSNDHGMVGSERLRLVFPSIRLQMKEFTSKVNLCTDGVPIMNVIDDGPDHTSAIRNIGSSLPILRSAYLMHDWKTVRFVAHHWTYLATSAVAAAAAGLNAVDTKLSNNPSVSLRQPNAIKAPKQKEHDNNAETDRRLLYSEETEVNQLRREKATYPNKDGNFICRFRPSMLVTSSTLSSINELETKHLSFNENDNSEGAEGIRTNNLNNGFEFQCPVPDSIVQEMLREKSQSGAEQPRMYVDLASIPSSNELANQKTGEEPIAGQLPAFDVGNTEKISNGENRLLQLDDLPRWENIPVCDSSELLHT